MNDFTEIIHLEASLRYVKDHLEVYVRGDTPDLQPVHLRNEDGRLVVHEHPVGGRMQPILRLPNPYSYSIDEWDETESRPRRVEFCAKKV